MQNFEISYPKKVSEFEIQATLYSKLKLLGFDVKGEVTHRLEGQEKGFRQCRFDLVIFEKGKAVFIIEVKNHNKTSFTTRQDRKYSKYEAELMYCTSMGGVDNLIDYLINSNTLK